MITPSAAHGFLHATFRFASYTLVRFTFRAARSRKQDHVATQIRRFASWNSCRAPGNLLDAEFCPGGCIDRRLGIDRRKVVCASWGKACLLLPRRRRDSRSLLLPLAGLEQGWHRQSAPQPRQAALDHSKPRIPESSDGDFSQQQQSESYRRSKLHLPTTA